MMFQSLLTEIGITGWMLRMFCVPFSGPKLRLVLFWNGRLIRLPTGFCASFASSSALISACAGVVARSASPRNDGSCRPTSVAFMSSRHRRRRPTARQRRQFRSASLKYFVPDTVSVAESPVFVSWYR